MSTLLRTFRAADARAALAAVKAALGSEAVIVSTREVGSGLFKSPEIEVTASAPETVAPSEAAPVELKPKGYPGAYSKGARAARLAELEERIPVHAPAPSVKPAMPPRTLRPATPPPPPQAAVEEQREEQREERQEERREAQRPEQPNEAAWERNDSWTPNAPPRPPVIARQTAAVPPGLRRAAETAEVGQELQRLRNALEEVRSQLSGARPDRESFARGLSPAALEMLVHLQARGVEDAIAEEVVRQGAANAENDGTSLLESVRDALGERIVGSRGPWLPDRKRIVAFVGPTGVGKTTTLAKIAARSVLESKQKVSLITLDTYRVGASEQIARYGEIMNVPTYVARDHAELGRAIDRCAAADLVLIDTAGRSLSEAIARQAEMLRSIPTVQLYLVLSAAVGARELAGAVDRYRGLAPERLIFTKLDEAVGPGSVLSASLRIGRPVCAVADGQRVPEDIHALNTAQLVDLVMGNWSGVPAAAPAVRS